MRLASNTPMASRVCQLISLFCVQILVFGMISRISVNSNRMLLSLLFAVWLTYFLRGHQAAASLSSKSWIFLASLTKYLFYYSKLICPITWNLYAMWVYSTSKVFHLVIIYYIFRLFKLSSIAMIKYPNPKYTYPSTNLYLILLTNINILINVTLV